MWNAICVIASIILSIVGIGWSIDRITSAFNGWPKEVDEWFYSLFCTWPLWIMLAIIHFVFVDILALITGLVTFLGVAQMGTFFALWGLAFWVLLLGELAVLVGCVRKQWSILAMVSLGLTFGLLQWGSGVNLAGWIWEHWPYALGFLGFYICAGIVWLLSKWHLYTSNQFRKYQDAKLAWCEERKVDVNHMTDEVMRDWKHHFERMHSDIEFMPKYRNHKEKLMGWLSFWPVSMFETFCFDFLAELFEHIYLRLTGILGAITKRNWAGAEHDFDK